MTDAAVSNGERLIRDAGIEKIGARIAERLEAAGIATVRQLADADIDQVVDILVEAFPRWRAETVQQRAVEVVALARERLPDEPKRDGQRHVFSLTLWADTNGHPVKSEFRYRDPDAPASQEMAGWSPQAFSRFVDRAAGLSGGRFLTEERIDVTELVEWSEHRVGGPLLRGGDEAGPVELTVPTDRPDAPDTRIRWRASGRLVPFGGGAMIPLGRCAGSVEHGEAIEIAFAARPIPRRLYRAWFDVAVSPPASLDGPSERGAQAGVRSG